MGRPSRGPGSTGHTRSSPSSRYGRAGAVSGSSRSRSSQRRSWSFHVNVSGLPRRHLLLAVLALLVLQAAVAVNVVYDETGWTKRDWHKYKIDHDLNTGVDPAEEVYKSPALKKFLSESRINSLHGPVQRKPVSKFAGMWAREDGSLVASPAEDAVEQAAEAVTCTTCHSLMSHVWGQLVLSINHADPISESSVKDLLEEACETQVPQKVLSKYRIVQVDAPEMDLALFVVRERKGTAAAPPPTTSSGSSGSSSSSDANSKGDAQELPDSSSSSSKSADSKAGAESSEDSKDKAAADSSSSSRSKGLLGSLPADVTPAEVEAVQKACTDLALHHAAFYQKLVWPQAKEFFKERMTLAQKILTKAEWYNDETFWEPDAYEDPDEEPSRTDKSTDVNDIDFAPARKLTPADQLCLDLDLMCPFWAQQGQCTANPAYMVGDKKHIGHCKASCKACEPKALWKKHPLAKQELHKAAAAAGQLLRTSGCSASRACMAGGSSTIGGAAAIKETGSLLPGAVLAKTPGFVLGKPFWGIPKVSNDDYGGLSERAHAADNPKGAKDPADEVLVSEGLANKLVSIPGMDNYFVYQLEFKRRVYQFHKDAQGNIKEEHVLGRYSPTATAAAARRDSLAANINLEAAKAWRAQWQLQRDASKHSSAAKRAEEGAGVGGMKPPPAPPMLELLDYLPDTENMLASHWPYMRQMYTEGEACNVNGKSIDRQVELRTACSPDSSLHLLVREPNFCQYIMVLYHPQLCGVDRLKPVPVMSGAGGTGSTGSKTGSEAAEKKAGKQPEKPPGDAEKPVGDIKKVGKQPEAGKEAEKPPAELGTDKVVKQPVELPKAAGSGVEESEAKQESGGSGASGKEGVAAEPPAMVPIGKGEGGGGKGSSEEDDSSKAKLSTS